MTIVSLMAGTAATISPIWASDSPPEENIAKGALYTLSPQPNYPLCNDTGDRTQLTDGALTEGRFWTQKSTVGWQRAAHVIITVDLSKIRPIGGVSLRTAAGTAEVCWPVAIRIHVSDDGKAFRDVGDLLELDRATLAAVPDGYAVQRFATSRLRTRGRYVRFLVLGAGPYVFVDEVEVFRGSESLLAKPPTGEPARSPEDYVGEHRVRWRASRRVETDAARIAEAIRGATLPETIRNDLVKRLAEARRALAPADLPSACSSRIVLPLNEAHAALFDVQSALWKAKGVPALHAWAAGQWDPLDAFAPPPLQEPSPMSVHTMLGEYRSAAFNLANCTDEPMRVRVSFDGFPSAPTPDYAAVHAVEWTDTVSGRLVASALPKAERKDGAWQITVLPGLVRQVWLTFHCSPDTLAGRREGRVIVSADGGHQTSVPLRLHVYPIRFPKATTLWLGGWGYTNGARHRGVTSENRDAFVTHLRDRFVNAPWATESVMMRFEFTGEDPLAVRLDTREFDEWLDNWPEARAYFVFLNIRTKFAGQTMGSEVFNRRVGAWISAWVRHLKTKGVSPERLALLLADEPHEHTRDDIIIAWAKAIKAAEPRVVIWEDPTYHDPSQARPGMFEACDVVCPNRPMWLDRGKPFEDFYLAQQQKGRTLQLYSCSGPSTVLDPYSYYRLQAWHCWSIGATGSFFWAFGDNGGSSSWNEYCAKHGPYTPMFLDDSSVTPGKQMEAIRESAEDYEYFVLLRAAVDRARTAGTSGPALDRAESLLSTAAGKVLTASGAETLSWHGAKDRSVADAVRVEILKALMELDGGR